MKFEVSKDGIIDQLMNGDNYDRIEAALNLMFRTAVFGVVMILTHLVPEVFAVASGFALGVTAFLAFFELYFYVPPSLQGIMSKFFYVAGTSDEPWPDPPKKK